MILNEKDWGLTCKQEQDWAKTIAVRIRAMCRHAGQAIGKTKPPAWAHQLGLPVSSSGSSSQDSSSSSAKVPKKKGSTVHVFGFDSELTKAWRAVEFPNGKVGEKELNSKWDTTECQEDGDP
eukprot:8162917-Alexandrium_andersonii.AAC.1